MIWEMRQNINRLDEKGNKGIPVNVTSRRTMVPKYLDEFFLICPWYIRLWQNIYRTSIICISIYVFR